MSYNNPTISSKFASISLAGGEQLIHDHTGVATDDTTDIYYGVKADINIASGNYSTELLYTTISDVSSEVNGEATITPSQVNNGYTATELTITTSLVTNKNLGTISAMIGSAACEDIELVTNNPVTVTCTLPAGLVGGKYNVVLNIPNLGKSYTIENGFEVSPQVTANVAEGSAGYGTISNNGFIAPYGTPITTNGNTITIGDQTITATPAAQTAQYDYAFANWTNNCGATVTGNCTITANFSRTTRSYTIIWDANGGSVSPTTTTKEYGAALGTLPTPTYAGYNFDGWFTAASGGTQILTTTTVTSDVTYYAHWTQAMRYMQDVASWRGELGLEEQVQVMDKRDGKVYWVAKLKDNNIWMTQNLDYDIVAGDNIVSNLDGTTSIWNASSAYAPQATTTTIYSNSSATGTYSYDPGSNYIPNGTDTPTAITCTSNGGENCHYHQGNYYQWNAATAGTGGTITNTDATSSICPKGWRLPTSNSDSANYSFGNLVKQYGYTGSNQSSTSDSTLLSSPLFFAHGGLVASGLLGSQNFRGVYWSSRAHSTRVYSAYDLNFSSNDVGLSYDENRYYGFSVRCVAIDPTLNGISTMQEMTPAIVAATPENTSKQLIDTRDNKLYWVTKLKDGNIWMTQNLDYDLSVVANQTLTPATSNVTTTRTVTPVSWGSAYSSVYYKDGGDDYYANGTTITSGYSSLPSNDINRHYAAGDYYSWNAATAGTGGTITDADATSSICPKGWRLPTSNSADASYSFGNLVKQYGYSGSNQTSGVTDSTLLASPLFFARGGHVSTGSLRYQGSYGFYWSSRATSDTNYAYILYFGSSYVTPSGNYGRDYGFSVRCVAL